MLNSLLPNMELVAAKGSRTYGRHSALDFAFPLACDRDPQDLAKLINDRFSPDYESSRDKFRALARSAAARVFSYGIEGTTSKGEALTIDFAELGADPTSESIRTTLVVLAGVHGSEGFAGAAIQEEILATRPKLPPNCRLVLVHALNPFGMAYDRRATANNIDLNRNFTGVHSGVPDGYREIRHLVLPNDPSDLEHAIERLSALDAVERRKLLQRLAPGQYEYPDDPFFGGAKLEPNIEILLRHLGEHGHGEERHLFLDIHTGLGAGGEETLFFLGADSALAERLGNVLGERHSLRDPMATVPYADRVHGNVAEGLARTFSEYGGAACICEIGTYPDLLLPILVLEHYCARFPDSRLQETARDLSREFFSPSDINWRRHLLASGSDIVRRAADAVFSVGCGH